MSETTPENTTPFQPGDLLETIKKLHKSEYQRERPKGTRFTVEGYVPAEESEDGKPFYWGSTSGGLNNIIVPTKHVKLIKSANQMAQRTVPTVAELTRALNSALHVSADKFSIDETDQDQDSGTIECAGETEDGLRFAFTVSISQPYQADF